MLSNAIRPPSEPNSLSSGSHSPHTHHAPHPSDSTSISEQTSSRASPLGRSNNSSAPPRASTSTLKPVSQQQLLAEHQDPSLALLQLVKEYNTLVFTSSQQDAEKSKAMAENSKLWNWCGSLKKERDALQRENEKMQRERFRWERRLVDLEQACRNAGVAIPPLDENLQEEELADGKDLRRPINVRSLSDSSNAVRKIIELSKGETPARISVEKDRGLNGRIRQHSAGGDLLASSSAHRPRHPSGPRALSVELGKTSASLTGSLPASSSLSANSTYPDIDLPIPGPANQHLTITEESSPNKYQLAGVPSLVSPFGPLFQKTGSGTALVATSPSSPIASTHPPSPLSREDPLDEEAADQVPDALGISIGPQSESLHRSALSEPVLPHSDTLPPAAYRTHPPSGIRIPNSGSAERVDRELLQTPVQENMPLPQFQTPQSSMTRPSMDSMQTAATASPAPDREARDRAKRHEQRARDRDRDKEKEAALAGDQRPRASSAPQAPSPNIGSSQLFSSGPSSSSKSRKEASITLNPALLPFLRIRVVNSHIRTNDRSREVISFSICVILDNPDASSPSQKWYIEKRYSDVLALDQAVKAKHSRSQSRKIANLPDKSLFKDHAPSKVDLRKVCPISQARPSV